MAINDFLTGGVMDDRNVMSRGIMNSPYFDMSNFYMPQSFKDLARWSLFYYMNDPIVKPAIDKTSQYPITDVVTDPKLNDELTKVYKRAYKAMKLDELLKRFGREYFAMGNVFAVAYESFTRYLVCKKCGEESTLASMNHEKLYFVKAEFSGECPHCKTNSKFSVKDISIKADPKVVFLDLFNIELKTNPVTGDETVYYTIPREVDEMLEKTSDVDFWLTIPNDYLEAKKQKKKLKFKKKVYHAKFNAVPSSKYGNWGIPLVQSALRSLYFKWSLRKTNLVIAQDRLDSKRYICPAGLNGDGTTLAGGTGILFKKGVQSELQEWQMDKNHIAVFPENIIYGRIDGEGKMFLTLEEEKVLDEEIITSMGLPIEFIKGGLQWSGSNVSLRMLENFMLSYRVAIHDFLDFINESIEKVHGMEHHATTTLEEFKMADDIQQQNAKVSLMQAKVISETQVAKEMGYSFEDQVKMMTKDEELKKDLIERYAYNQALLQKIATKEAAIGNVEAQKMAAELSLMNFDGGYKVRDIEVTPEGIKAWRDQDFPTGGLTKAIDANARQQMFGNELQLQAMQEQAAMQQQMQGPQPVDAGGMPVQQPQGDGQQQGDEQGQPQQGQPQGSPAQAVPSGGFDLKALLQRFDRISRLDDEMATTEVQNMTEDLSPEDVEELMDKYNTFMSVKAMKEKGLTTTDIKAFMKDNGVASDDFADNVIKYITVAHSMRNFKPAQSGANPFAWKNGGKSSGGKEDKPLPEKLPPRRENSPV